MKFIGSAAVVDRATIRLLAIKANAVADVEKSRLVTGHFHHLRKLLAVLALTVASFTASSRVLVVFSGPFGIFITNH